jgi:hypothetical protein
LKAAGFLARNAIIPKIETKFNIKDASIAHLYKEDETRKRSGQIVLLIGDSDK